MEKEKTRCVSTHMLPFRRLLFATLLIMMILPIIGKAQDNQLLYAGQDLRANIWLESPSTPGAYKRMRENVCQLESYPISAPPYCNILTLSTCNKFSLDLKYRSHDLFLVDPNPQFVFYNPDGSVYAQYTDPDSSETNFGNYLNYTNGITPDFQITTPGSYLLKVYHQAGGSGVIDSTYWFQVNVLDTNLSISLNTPDTVCYNTNVCWSVFPNIYDSLSGNWGVNANFSTSYEDPTDPFNPCAQALTLGNQTITVYARDFCGRDTTLTKNFYVKYMSDFTLPTSICPNQLFNVGEIFYCRYPNNSTSFLWNWGDGTTSNTQNATHSYANSGTYTVSLTIGAYIGGQTQYSTMSKTIFVSQMPSVPILTGTFTTCSNPGNYTITNPQSNTSYTWTSPYSTSITGSDTLKNIAWNMNIFPTLANETYNLNPIPGYFTIIANNNGCVDTTEFKVWKCCTRDSRPTYSDTIITSSFPIGEVYINGTIIIDTNLTQANTKFLMGPEAKIIVNPPYTFELNGQTTMGDGCRQMWDGIYVENPQSKIKFNNVSKIFGAMNAIYSKNGGNFEVINSNFNSNYISVKVTDYKSANHPGTIIGTTFRTNQTLTIPNTSQRAYAGIYVENIRNLNIGSITANYNIFDSLYSGIQAYNSAITLEKNKFQSIKSTPICDNSGNTDFIGMHCETAIHIAQKPGFDIIIPSITMNGGSLANGNIFYDCGIAYNSYKTKQTIKYCTADTAQSVFRIRDAGISNISNNKITGAKYGIYFVNTSPAEKNITIDNNEININKTACFGISLYNCKSSAYNALMKVKATNNLIKYTIQFPTSAIISSNCDYITITGNNLINNGTAPCNYTWRKTMLGIVTTNSPNSLIKSNSITKFGTAIWAEGLETDTKFQCNTLTQNYYGFYMPNASGSTTTIYSDQKTPEGYPNDNQWTDHPSPNTYYPTYRITGDANSSIVPKNWYYRAGTNSYYPNVISPNPATSFALMFQLPSSYPSPCGSKGGDDEDIVISDSTTTIESIIPDNSNLAVQMRYLYMSMLFNSNTELFANEIGQVEQDLYTNIPLIAKINHLAQCDTTIDRAIELNNSLVPVNEMETNRKVVNNIYLNYVAKEVQPSNELIVELYTIADMAPNIGGEAVYIARAILNYEPTTRNKQDFDILAKLSINDNIQWYPNPAIDILNIASLETFATGSKIELYDITGRMVLSTVIDSESNILTISLKELKQGLYLCVIKKGEEILSSSKISIIKQ